MRTCAVCRQARIEYLVFLDGLLRLANIHLLIFLSQGGRGPVWSLLGSASGYKC
jgi:hypothetical protein